MSEYSNTTQLNYSMHFFSYYYALSAQKVHVLQTAVVLRDHRTWIGTHFTHAREVSVLCTSNWWMCPRDQIILRHPFMPSSIFIHSMSRGLQEGGGEGRDRAFPCWACIDANSSLDNMVAPLMSLPAVSGIVDSYYWFYSKLPKLSIDSSSHF